MSNVIVRAQLEKTLKTKRTRRRSLHNQEARLREQAGELAYKRAALEAEISELHKHLESLGGALSKEERDELV